MLTIFVLYCTYVIQIVSTLILKRILPVESGTFSFKTVNTPGNGIRLSDTGRDIPGGNLNFEF